MAFNFAEFYGVPRLGYLLQIQGEENLDEFEETEMLMLMDLIEGKITAAHYLQASALESQRLQMFEKQIAFDSWHPPLVR